MVVKEGLCFDYVVVGDELEVGGCLGFYMVLVNVLVLQIDDVVCCIKVDDMVLGIEEGICVGMWIVGFFFLGNEVGFM